MKVLITGTSRGIGRACALKYLAAGHEVIGFDLRENTINTTGPGAGLSGSSSPKSEKSCRYKIFRSRICAARRPKLHDPSEKSPSRISLQGAALASGKVSKSAKNDSSVSTLGSYTHYIVDITKELPEIEGVQILVNNAGVQEGGNEIDVNLKGTIAVTEKYGITPQIHSVVFMASSSASNGAEFPLYAASKGGVVAYMKNVALRIAQYGATCNSISAGGVLTELNQHIIENPHLMQQCLAETLLHKWAQPGEIAELCYFLTCVNRSMTGQDLLIDNGEQLKSNFIW